MDVYSQAVLKIIKAQEGIIGPIALEQAQKISGLKINVSNNEVALTGNEKEILEKLVAKYEIIFGQTSVEVCRHAAKDILSKLPQEQVPSLLK